MSEDNENMVTFVLTGPRKGYTGVLGGRYGFRDGKLKVPASMKDALKLILCNRYCCNIEGEAPIWKEVQSQGIVRGKKVDRMASVKVRHVEVTKKAEETTVVKAPEPVVKAPTPSKS